LPSNKREKFLREMVRISRYGIFFNQNITNSIGTYSVDALLSTLFTDYTGFFTEVEADELIRKMNLKHYTFLPIIQGESRLAAMFTSKNDVPLSRIPNLNAPQRDALAKSDIRTAKDVLIAGTSVINGLGIDVEALRTSAIKLLFP
jgi:hypothetical protein